MAQSSSAAREPSMEEILASIRKIIEDSDTAQPELQEPASQRTSADVKTFPRVPNPVADAPEPDEPAAEIDEPALSLEPVNLNHDPRTVPESDTAVEPEDDWALEAELSAAGLDLDGPAETAGGAVEAEPEGNDATMATGHEIPETGAGPVTADGKAIVSPATVRQVTAAFENLNQAVAAENRRTFEEIAEELLRPMLQEWLDDNLPTLVERLVREEIQRVVRGSRD